MYEEWPLQDVLKRVTQGSRTVSNFNSRGTPVLATERHAVVLRASVQKPEVSGTKFTKDEDELLIKLKEVDCLPWVEIHRRFSKEYRGQSQGTLQVRYSNKLKGRKQRAGRG